MSWDEYPSWFRRRRRRFPFFSDWYFRDIEEMMKDMERMMEGMLREFTNQVPKSLTRERKLPDGSTFREMGPFVWGWSITMGSDGKPVIREFGNLRPSTRARPWEPPFNLREEREPLVDVLEGDREIRVVAELPGVEKEDIKLHATERTLTISVDTAKRKYHKELELPDKVDPSSARSSYKNGVLEVELKKVGEKPKGVRIKID
jgi:HSP20 family protein